MSAAVMDLPAASGLDLPQHDDGCELEKGTCGAPVVAIALWQEPWCHCGVSPARICRPHLDQVNRALADGGWLICLWCDSVIYVDRVMPL